MNTGRVALIAGSTGIVGGNLAALLVEQGWTVYGLARRPSSTGGVIPLAADLRDHNSLVAALDGRDHLWGAWSGVQHFERRPVPVALALAADCRVFRCRVARAAGSWNASAGASNERCRATLEGACGETPTGGAGCEPACLVVAYGRRPGPHARMCERHDGEPCAQLLCVPIHTRFFF